MRAYSSSDICECPWKNSTSQCGPGSALGYLKNSTSRRLTHQSTGLPGCGMQAGKPSPTAKPLKWIGLPVGPVTGSSSHSFAKRGTYTPAYDSPTSVTGCCEASNSGKASRKKAACARWLAFAVDLSVQGPQVYGSPLGPPWLVALPLPIVQYEAPIGAGESISQRLVTLAHVHALKSGVGTLVARNSAVRVESEVSRNGPNSWKSPNVDGAPGPPLYQIESGFSFQSGAIAQM
mmetsp:Transcript_27634/g.88713  ORF Transcript_27634/g.88713 Transcript_27634/m.88713 type:complete len:234 (+) Transcript_27634:188-889(+)